MSTFRIFVFTSVLAVSMAGCVFGTTEENPDGPVLGEAMSSGCKVESGLVVRSVLDGNMIEAVAYDTSATIIHHDAMYQCNADISWEMEVNGAELLLREVDKSVEVTNCMCPIDLSIGIENLSPGVTYHVQVWDEFETKMFGEVWITVGDCDAQCTVADDCWNYPELPRLDCNGGWECLDGLCNWYCDDTPTGCQSDEDCADGFQCVFYSTVYDATNPDGTDASGADMMAYECTTDTDCPEGMICMIADCACADDQDCECYPYGWCEGVLWPVEGVCEPIEVNNECRTDADCGSGYHCEFYYPDASGAEGDAAMPYEMPPEDCICTEEWAPVCGTDGQTYSNDCFAWCAGVQIAYVGECAEGQGIGYCVADEDKGCYSDSDCPDGYVCEMTDWCAGVDADGDGVVDPTWCMGQCVAYQVETCESMGGFCFPYTDNGACPEGSSWIYGNAYPDGLCGDESICCIPTDQECTTDDDCYKIYGDVPADPATGVPTAWSCVDGVCLARTECGVYGCYTDADCGDGFVCMVETFCDDAGTCCESTSCLPVEQPMCDDSTSCAEGETCVNGECVVVDVPCAADADCIEGYTCVDGVCVAKAEECRMDESGMCVCGGFAGFACPAYMYCVYDDPNCDPENGGADCMGHCHYLAD